MKRDLSQRGASGSFIYDPKFRGLLFQIVVGTAVLVFFAALIHNVIENLARNRITSGFGFLQSVAGFDISQTLIEYSLQSTIWRAFWVGLLNTLLIAILGIILATILGFIIGIARLSSNWLVARVADSYVALIRNIPLLLHLLFWYNAVLKALPDFRESLHIPGGGLLNSRGLFFARPSIEQGGTAVAAALGVAIVVVFALWLRARAKRKETGVAPRIWPAGLLILLLLPSLAAMVSGFQVSWARPELSRFNVSGGLEILPEFAALLFGLVIYTASFIAEVVRAGLMSVPYGQSEAAAALGLRRAQALKYVIIPQAKRVIIPPLTNQYLNLTKNSTLAVAIGYPDFVQIFTGTVLNVTGQAVEVVAMTLAVYLLISLLTAFAMSRYQARVAMVQR
ncbi:MAG: amino acid ABC transporter permease [Xanthobacteraceae bacterium]